MKPLEWKPLEHRMRHAMIDIGSAKFQVWDYGDDPGLLDFIETGSRLHYDRHDITLFELMCHIEFVKQELERNGK